MQQFLYAHGSGQDAEQLLEHCLSRLGPVPDGANLGFIYATTPLCNSLDWIISELTASTAVRQWTGTVGFGISAMGNEYYDEPALAIMIGDFPENAYQTVPLLSTDVDGFIHGTGDWLQRDEFYFGVIHGDPGNPKTPALINQLAASVPSAFLVGGLTSSPDLHPQVINDSVNGGGISGVLFSSEVPVITSHTQGCTPLAGKHLITAAEQNIIIELDDRPALEVFREDIGEVLAKDLQQAAGYIFAGLPVPGSDTGDYLVRNLMGIDVEHQLIAVAEVVNEGSEIMFCQRDGNSAWSDMQRMLKDIKGRLKTEPRGALYYSCTARGRHQFGDDSEELKLIRDELGEIPLVGFFANGEIFHNRLYGYTGVLTVFC